jgi:hypothetical protein
MHLVVVTCTQSTRFSFCHVEIDVPVALVNRKLVGATWQHIFNGGNRDAKSRNLLNRDWGPIAL